LPESFRDFRGDQGEAIDGAPIVSFETWRDSLADVPVFISVGDPRARRVLAERVSAAGGRFASLYHATGPIAGDVLVGEGTVFGALISIGASTVIGRNIQVMPLASIDGGCVIGDFSDHLPVVDDLRAGRRRGGRLCRRRGASSTNPTS